MSGKTYADYMAILENSGYVSSLCTSGKLFNECILAPAFSSYRKDFTSFFAVFTVFFIIYVIVYHYAVKKLLPYQIEKKKEEGDENGKKIITIQNIKNVFIVVYRKLSLAKCLMST